MKIIKASYEILIPLNRDEIYKRIEVAAAIKKFNEYKL